MARRVKWIEASDTDDLVAQGTRVSVYGFRMIGSSAAVFRTGGAAGTILARNGDPLGSGDNYIEFPDGVHVTLTGAGTGAILVDEGQDPA